MHTYMMSQRAEPRHIAHNASAAIFNHIPHPFGHVLPERKHPGEGAYLACNAKPTAGGRFESKWQFADLAEYGFSLSIVVERDVHAGDEDLHAPSAVVCGEDHLALILSAVLGKDSPVLSPFRQIETFLGTNRGASPPHFVASRIGMSCVAFCGVRRAMMPVPNAGLLIFFQGHAPEKKFSRPSGDHPTPPWRIRQGRPS